MAKILVLFVFHIYCDRVRRFIEKCIFQDENVDFVIVRNGHEDFECPDYVTKIFRENVGYDFGAWSEGLMKNDLYTKYDYFIFANSSVVGPFLRPNFKGKWTDIYIDGLKDNIKLFGSTINAIQDPKNKAHVQSYIFSMDKTTLEYLIQCGIFSITKHVTKFVDAIEQKEVLMSRKVIENGWNIGSLYNYYENIDFTFKTRSPEDYNIQFLDDVMWAHLRNVLWNEYDLVFVKGNRVGNIQPN